MRLIDLSQPVFDAGPNCPGHPPVISENRFNHEKEGWRLEVLTMSPHTGSHIDAPFHKLAHGRKIDEMPLESFYGQAVLADLRGIEPEGLITAERLAAKLPADVSDKIILMATGWGDIRERSDLWLNKAPKITPDCAEWIVAQKARALCVDHWGIGGWATPDNDAIVHTILLEAGVWIGEDLFFPAEVYDLPMPQTFIALPINLKGHSGAWIRPALMVG